MKRLLALALAAVACTSAPSASPASPASPAQSGFPATAAPTATPSPTPVATSALDAWTDDLRRLDRGVRTYHRDPFAIHSEAEWEQRMQEITPLLPDADPNEQIALVASLVGLLDTHSALVSVPRGWHWYGLLPYRFEDGWYVVNARDESLIGDRLVSIAGMRIEDVVATLTPLVPHDNDSGLLENVLWEINSVEFLTGAGVVADADRPSFGLETTDGAELTVDPPVLGEEEYDLAPVGWLSGEAPEAVERRGERIWTRLDERLRTFLVSINDYGDMSAASAALTQALDDGLVDRVVVDMRYLRGGNADISILDVLVNDARINRPGGLIVLIGQENVSAATLVAYALDTETDALLIGEPTPALANNFTCTCHDIRLPSSGFVVSVPGIRDNDGDDRPAVMPDISMGLSSTDFFAGRDPVLDAAMEGAQP